MLILKAGTSVETIFGPLLCYAHLSDVPENGQPALIVGSSGIEDKRFLEIVVPGGSAAKKLSLSPSGEFL